MNNDIRLSEFTTPLGRGSVISQDLTPLWMEKGFSLIELMIALVIVGILSCIAYPSYAHYMTKSRRSDAQIALLSLATNMERYYAENNTYKGASLTKFQINSVTAQGYYKLAITNLTPTSYLLRAVPQGVQAKNDQSCKTLTLDQLGQKSETGKGLVTECWG